MTTNLDTLYQEVQARAAQSASARHQAEEIALNSLAAEGVAKLRALIERDIPQNVREFLGIQSGDVFHIYWERSPWNSRDNTALAARCGPHPDYTQQVRPYAKFEFEVELVGGGTFSDWRIYGSISPSPGLHAALYLSGPSSPSCLAMGLIGPESDPSSFGEWLVVFLHTWPDQVEKAREWRSREEAQRHKALLELAQKEAEHQQACVEAEALLREAEAISLEIEGRIGRQAERLSRWPSSTVTVYRWSWCTAMRQDEEGTPVFDYDSGYSLDPEAAEGDWVYLLDRGRSIKLTGCTPIVERIHVGCRQDAIGEGLTDDVTAIPIEGARPVDLDFAPFAYSVHLMVWGGESSEPAFDIPKPWLRLLLGWPELRIVLTPP